MTSERPNVTDTGRYPIGLAAEKLGIDRGTLRRYVKARLIKPSTQRVNHRLIFTGRQLLALWEAIV